MLADFKTGAFIREIGEELVRKREESRMRRRASWVRRVWVSDPFKVAA